MDTGWAEEILSLLKSGDLPVGLFIQANILKWAEEHGRQDLSPNFFLKSNVLIKLTEGSEINSIVSLIRIRMQILEGDLEIFRIINLANSTTISVKFFLML